MQTIYLDISNKGVVPTVYAKQNDVGRKFAVILTDSGLPYIPVSGSAFSVWYKGASDEGNYTDIGDKSAFSLNGNKVEIEMIVQMLSAHGDGILCLTLNSPDGNQISSWNIPYICEMVPGSESEKAEEYYTAFSESVKKLKQVTENLTPEAIGAAPMEYTKKVGNPHNLLDNSDFRNPVNQRGQTSYSDSGKYTIDRWYLPTGTDIKVENGISFSENYFAQDFENERIKRNGVLTAAVMISTGLIVGTVNVSNIAVSRSADFVNSGNFRISILRKSETVWEFYVRAYASVTMLWAALYEGEYTIDTLPEYQPKGYGAELAECQRYLQRFQTETERKTYCEDFRPTMRMTPNGVVSKFEQNVDGVTYYFASAEL